MVDVATNTGAGGCGGKGVRSCDAGRSGESVGTCSSGGSGENCNNGAKGRDVELNNGAEGAEKKDLKDSVASDATTTPKTQEIKSEPMLHAATSDDKPHRHDEPSQNTNKASLKIARSYCRVNNDVIRAAKNTSLKWNASGHDAWRASLQNVKVK